ncbi:nitroreductase family protein [Dactylosporangium sp. NPDC049140]|uniref:nitroreductase family protein n=1 Tax=Dactylosporangium sp. NPDC049140 TaxID=3155647 RepID=UPI0033E48C92
MHTALLDAARDARLAPSILNTKPWRWETVGSALELHADPARRLPHLDPHGQLMTLSCGAALHHARLALAAAGYEPVVERRPDADHPTLLARIGLGEERPAGRECLETYRCLPLRRTDRRPFPPGARVPDATLTRLRAAAEAEGAHLYVLAREDVAYLRYAAQGAHTLGAHDAEIAAELERWAGAARPAPLRDAGSGAEYLVVATDADGPDDWLKAGEATSAVWLTATACGLAASPLSEVVEVPGARKLIRSLLHPPREPQLVLRVGVAAPH